MDFYDLLCIDRRPADAEQAMSFAQDCKHRLVDPISWLQSNEALSRADEPKRTRNLLSSTHNALVNEPGCIWPHSRDDRWSTSIRAQQAYRPNHWSK